MNRLSMVAEYTNRTQAEIAKAALEARNINAVVRGDDLGGLGPGQSFVHRIQVLVEEQDLDTAKELLGEG